MTKCILGSRKIRLKLNDFKIFSARFQQQLLLQWISRYKFGRIKELQFNFLKDLATLITTDSKSNEEMKRTTVLMTAEQIQSRESK